MEIVKDIEIDIGHRIMQHESKCRHVHGHRLRLCIHASASKLDSVGRIVDFGVIKGVIGKWLNDNLDHVFVANPKDPTIEFLKSQGLRYYVMKFPMTDKAYAYLKSSMPSALLGQVYSGESLEPTSENIARMVFEEAFLMTLTVPELKGIYITRIEVFETPSSSADFTEDDLRTALYHYVVPPPSSEGYKPWWTRFLPPAE